MIPGPIAIVLLAVLVLRLSPEPVNWGGVLLFTAVALPTWIVLQLGFGRILRAVAYRRSPVSAALLDASAPYGGSAESWRELMEDPIYGTVWFLLFLLKWAAVIAAGSLLAL